jgi:predicted membrane chloride channel (bestrophin family)
MRDQPRVMKRQRPVLNLTTNNVVIGCQSSSELLYGTNRGNSNVRVGCHRFRPMRVHVVALIISILLPTIQGGSFLLHNIVENSLLQQHRHPYHHHHHHWKQRQPVSYSSSRCVLKEPDKETTATAQPHVSTSVLPDSFRAEFSFNDDNKIEERYLNDPSTFTISDKNRQFHQGGIHQRNGGRPNNSISSSSSSSNSNSSKRNSPDDPNAEYRYSASDWWQIIRTTFRSSTLKATRGPVIAVMVWSYCLSAIYSILCYTGRTEIAHTFVHCLPSTIPHAATVSALGLLLVFRTTSAYQKFDEGRLIWERILSITRNITRQIYIYPEFSDDRTARILQLLAAYPYFLHQHVKPNFIQTSSSTTTTTTTSTEATAKYEPSTTTSVANTGAVSFLSRFRPKKQPFQTPPRVNIEDALPRHQKIVTDQLPWSLFFRDDDDEDGNNNLISPKNRKIIQQLMKVENRPLWICDRIAEEIVQVPCAVGTTYTSMERIILLNFINELTEAVSECERIHRTTVPLNYARHSLRGLTFWLFTLPFTLLASYKWWTSPVMGLTAWVFYGIYQIGYMIEDPFQGTIRLTTLCDNIYRDVICDPRRTSAFAVSFGKNGAWKDLPL